MTLTILFCVFSLNENVENDGVFILFRNGTQNVVTQTQLYYYIISNLFFFVLIIVLRNLRKHYKKKELTFD